MPYDSEMWPEKVKHELKLDKTAESDQMGLR